MISFSCISAWKFTGKFFTMIKLKKQSGSVMTMALFLIIVISAFGLASSGIVTSDFIATKKYKNSITAEFLARAGVEKVFQVLWHDNSSYDSPASLWCADESSFKEVPLDIGYFNVCYVVEDKLFYGINDEESKLNINKASREMLKGLPGFSEVEADAVINSRRKMIFRKPEELVTRGIVGHEQFYGSCARGGKGLEMFVTVWGNGKININTASRVVLETIPGLYANNVDDILMYRNGYDGVAGTSDDGVFKSVNDITAMQKESWISIRGDILTVKSRTFRVRSVGVIQKNSPTRAKRVIDAVVLKDKNDIRVLYWNMI